MEQPTKDLMPRTKLANLSAQLAKSAEPFLALKVNAEAEFDGRLVSLGFAWREDEGPEIFNQRCETMRYSLAQAVRALRGDYGPQSKTEVEALL